jgi:UDP-glucose 4-epimerase
MIRDYCYVGDIAQANMAAAFQQKMGIYNIGTGRGTNTLELYRLVARTLREKGVDVPVAFDNPKPGMARDGDIRVSTLNAARAERELGFKAARDLKAGLGETIDWYLSKRQK